MTIDKYTLHRDPKSNKWRLEKERSDRAKRIFDTKKDALKELRDAVGPNGASVRIRKADNTKLDSPRRHLIFMPVAKRGLSFIAPQNFCP